MLSVQVPLLRFRLPASATKFLKNVKTSVENHPLVFATFLLTAISNYALWVELFHLMGGFSTGNLVFVTAFYLLLSFLTLLLLNLVNLKYLIKPVLIFLYLASSFANYFMVDYGTMIDPSMLQNVFETDAHEVADLINLDMLLHVVLLGILPSLIIYKLRFQHRPMLSQLLRNVFAVIACLLATTVTFSMFYSEFASMFRTHRHIRYLANPLNYIYALEANAARVLHSGNEPVHVIGMDALIKNTASRPSLIILVVGETARADHFSLNGYSRDTNQFLKKEDVINFNNFWSCGTSTAISLPCMFSHFDRDSFDEGDAVNYEKLPDVLSHAGIQVSWKDNNSGCKGVCRNIPSENVTHLHLPELCNDEECFDEALLHGLRKKLANGNSSQVVILHQKGSHGPAYYLRYPKKFSRFQPTCQSSELYSCKTSEVVNGYDNTIAYTDYFLSRVINLLKQESDRYDTAMIYVSDHGESLGENNVYLHSLPYFLAPDAQKHVPFLIWLSDQFTHEHHIDQQCLRRHATERYNHDYLFHSVLGLADVSSSVYKPELDIFNICRTREVLATASIARQNNVP